MGPYDFVSFSISANVNSPTASIAQTVDIIVNVTNSVNALSFRRRLCAQHPMQAAIEVVKANATEVDMAKKKPQM